MRERKNYCAVIRKDVAFNLKINWWSGSKHKTGKGSRYIVLYAGSEKGFADGALMMFKSKNGTKGDYLDSMTMENSRSNCYKKLKILMKTQ